MADGVEHWEIGVAIAVGKALFQGHISCIRVAPHRAGFREALMCRPEIREPVHTGPRSPCLSADTGRFKFGRDDINGAGKSCASSRARTASVPLTMQTR